MEYMGRRSTTVTNLLFGIDSLVFIISPMILMFVTKNTDAFMYLGIEMCLVVIILFHYY
jgi:hypothetical protein